MIYRTIIWALFLMNSMAPAQTTLSGGRGMLRVFSAETVQAGSVFLNSFYLAFFRSAGNDLTFNMGVTYGISNSVELTAQAVPYQDDQMHKWGPPGDTQLGMKWRSPLASSRISSGLRAFVILPTALQHNARFEPYSSNQVAWGIMGLLTFDFTNSSGSFPLKVHTNFGYLDHNIETLSFKDDTDQVLFGLGIKFSAHPFILYTEYTGEFFVNNALVRFGDNSMRLTQGFKFLAPLNLIVDFGLDIGLSRSLDAYQPPLHQYADWKIFTGMTVHFKTRKVSGLAARETKIDRKQHSRALEMLRDRRKSVGQDLEKMRKKLKKTKQKNL
ncbi:MAG: hypothetical protein ACE5G1_04730 [bacterium]